MDGKIAKSIQVGSATAFAKWSPDGRYVLTGGTDKTLRIWDYKTGTIKKQVHVNGPLLDAAWRDDKFFASADETGAVSFWKLGQDRPTRQWTHAQVEELCWGGSDQADKRLLATRGGTTVFVWSPDADAAMQSLSGHSDDVTSFCWSSRAVDSSPCLATTSADGSTRVWNINKNTSVALKQHAEAATAVSFTPDGGLLATVSKDSNCFIYQVDSLSNPRVSVKYSGKGAAVQWSSDGKRLACLAGPDSLYLAAFEV
eukprot:NODE_3562_length_877_cov_50.850667_g3540_i0.p1 GENE.NODE_3562_length_877_cov_50.850667_g3540_i0~~NODE_3562_length_877_cov_50.850667_g3540_i0.p1  ORF type:complete len:286 (+),score=53.27 NODE_3562_length_877_cov_50.850667_g3540_i0:91-858(+)